MFDVSNPLLSAEQRWNLFLGANMFLVGSLLAAESENNPVVPTIFCFAGSSGLSLLRNKRLWRRCLRSRSPRRNWPPRLSHRRPVALYCMSWVAVLSWLQAFGPNVYCLDYVQCSHEDYHSCQCTYGLMFFQRHALKATTKFSYNVCKNNPEWSYWDVVAAVDVGLYSFAHVWVWLTLQYGLPSLLNGMLVMSALKVLFHGVIFLH